MTRPERLRLALATGLGLGYSPVAPGTVGSLAGLALVWPLWWIGGPWAVVAGAAGIVALGGWASGVARTHFRRPDPGHVVIDEIAGQMVALLFVVPTLATLVGGWLLFRLFDIWKPYPIRRLERLPGASGIMADDLLAGVFANFVLQVVQRLFESWWGNA